MSQLTGAPTRVLTRLCATAIAVTLVCSLAALIRGVEPRTLQTQAVTGGPAVGTVADITWGISLADIDRTIAAMRQAGITWVRANQNWKAAEPDAKGVANTSWYATVDYAVKQARAAGMQVLMPISDGVPYWASADPAKFVDAAGVRRWNSFWRPTSDSDFAAFVSTTVNRYKAMGVQVYEIWNEPNAPSFWPSGPNPADYTAMLRAAYPAVKAADPTAKVILGGLSKSDWGYLDGLYAAGAAPYFDEVAVHPYTGAVNPDWCWNQAGTTRFAKDAFCGIEEIRRSMVANGDSAKSIWLTEFGWSTTTSTYGVSEATQADYVTASLNKMRSSYPYVSTAFYYNFRNSYWYNDDPAEIEANWGLLRTDFSAKPALAAITAFAASVQPSTISISDSTVVGGAAGTTANATFTLSLSTPASAAVTVSAATANGSALAGSDYTSMSPTTVSFASGETSKTVTVPVIGDSVPEGDESFVVNLSSPAGAALADAQGAATILDPLGAPSLSINDVTVLEPPLGGSATAAFTVSLAARTDRQVTVVAATANGSAVAGPDYTALAPTTITFAPGETTKSLSAAVTGDSVAEARETFVVNLSSPAGGTLADAQGQATVVDPQLSPAVSISDVTVVGGPAGASTNAIFTLSLSAPAPTSGASVTVATANGSALGGSDYTTLAPTTVGFAAGETTRTVAVAVTGDSVAEADETFVVNLSSPVGLILADPQAQGTILDPLGVPTLSISDVTVNEGLLGATTTAAFTISLSARTDQTVVVKAATANGSAVAGSDYTAVGSGNVKFAAGETAKTVNVPVTGDSVTEANETFVVNLSSPVGARLNDPQGVATILDPAGSLLSGGAVPSLSVSDVTVVGGVSGASATFNISLSAPAPLLGLTVRAATANGSALAGSDYTALAATTITFASGERTKAVNVPVIGDSVAEGNETFVLNLSSPAGAALADSQGAATILDPLGVPAISVNEVSVAEGAPGTTAVASFTVSLSAPTDRTVTVAASTANGSALAGSDYTALTGSTISFAPGERSRTVTVAVSGDSVVETNETFLLNLSSPVGATLSDPRGAATILDTLGLPGISINDVAVVEGPTSTTATATFTLSLSAPSGQTVTVRAATANGSAIAGSDYTALAATTISFAPGERTKTVTLAVTGDSVAEGNETFVLDLSSPAGAALSDSQGVATILDPLGRPTP